MLHSLKNLETYSLGATDGNIEHVKNFYSEDDTWVVLYLGAQAGSWLSSRQVLISPISLQQPDWFERTMPVSITKVQVKNCPDENMGLDTDTDTDTDMPVSRQSEAQHHGDNGHHGRPVYWESAGLWGEAMLSNALVPGDGCYGTDRSERERQPAAHLSGEHERHRNDDSHLLNCNAVIGSHIHAIDGDMGHVSHSSVDDETWSVRYLIVDTSNGWVGHKILVASLSIQSVNWFDHSGSVNLSRESIKTSPTFDLAADSAVHWDRDCEIRLYRPRRRPAEQVSDRCLASKI